MTLKLIKSIRKDLGFFFIGALLTVCIIDFWLSDIPELFSGGYKLGQIIYKLCMSYISAFIFYFLVVHIKQQKDKENLYLYVSKKVHIINSSASGLISAISKASKITLTEKYPSKEELDIICKSINPNTNAPLVLGPRDNYANWIQYFNYSKKRSNDATEKVFRKMPFLETELVNILSRIEDNDFFTVLPHFTYDRPIGNQDITVFKQCLFSYFELIKELEKYTDKKLFKYK